MTGEVSRSLTRLECVYTRRTRRQRYKPAGDGRGKERQRSPQLAPPLTVTLSRRWLWRWRLNSLAELGEERLLCTQHASREGVCLCEVEAAGGRDSHLWAGGVLS